MSRGEIWWVDFDPSRDSETAKRRPAVIVGRDLFVRHAMLHARGTVTVVPITSNVSTLYDFQVLLPAGSGGLTFDSKAQAEQIRTIAVSRLVERIGAVDASTSARIHEAVGLYLGL